MTVRILTLDAAGEIPDDLKTAMISELEAALPRIKAALTLRPVDVCFYSYPGGCIPEEGMCGFATNAGLIHIVCDPGSPHLLGPDRSRNLAGTLAHELHHAARNQGPGYGKTLGEALVSEGLAQAFEAAMTGHVPFYAVALDTSTLDRIAALALPDLDKEDYDHNGWFFGNTQGFPRHGGYSLGYALVTAHLDATGQSAAALAKVPAAEILDAWRAGRFVPAAPSAA
jgi:uncharacterized protein YjaZ